MNDKKKPRPALGSDPDFQAKRAAGVDRTGMFGDDPNRGAPVKYYSQGDDPADMVAEAEVAVADVVAVAEAALDPFSVWVRARRQALDLTQRALAERCDMVAPAITRIESGMVPRIDIMRRLCLVLGPYTVGRLEGRKAERARLAQDY